eukprot:gene1146-1292_t
MHTSGGDMRKAVTFLQSAYQLSGGEPITPLMVVEISGQIPSDVMCLLWVAMEGKHLDAVRSAVAHIIAEGYPMSSLLDQLQDDVLYRSSLTDIDKALICQQIAQADHSLSD